MKLLNLTLTNFQGIRSLTLDFPSGHSASIYGDNATGKTTVYNALTWLLFDKASTSAKNFTPKTKGANGDLHHLDHGVSATFQADDGRIVSLQKTYKEVYKKKRGSATEEFSGHTVDYAIDGVPAKEKEYTATITALCGGDTEKPKMLTMPDYFPEQLAWDTRRKILLEICGDISDNEVIAAHGELKELPDFLRMPGTAERYYTTEEYGKIATARKNEINKQLADLPGRIDEAERAIPDTTGLVEEEIEAAIAALNKKRDTLTEEKAMVSTGGTATAECQKQIADLRTKIAEGKAEHLDAYNKQNADVAADIIMVQREVRQHQQTAEDARARARSKANEKAQIDDLRKRLIEEYNRVSAETWDESQTVCPTCHQTLPADQIEQMREDFNQRKSKRLEEINLRGKTSASKTTIGKLADEIAELQKKEKEASDLAEEAKKKLAELEGRKTQPTPYEETEAYKDLMKQITELQANAADEKETTRAATDALAAKIDDVAAAIREKQDKRMQLTMAENQKRRIAELEDQEKRLNSEYEETQKGLYLCELFTKAKVSMLDDKINSKFKSVRFRLFQEQINGGIKEDCEVMVPTEDGRLVPYTFANNAARINAGLEIIDTLAAHWGVNMPIFIDNAESVTHLIGTKAQTIRLVVSEADKQLRLDVTDNG